MFKKEDAKNVEKRYDRSGKSYKVYTFECIQCGSDIFKQSYRVGRGSGLCRSCSQKGRPYEHILNELRHTCKSRGVHQVSITYEEFLYIIEDRKCHYCSKELIYHPHTRDDNRDYVSRAYQLDRKDNSLGYTLENSVSCCWECNRLKSDIYSYEEFLLLVPGLKEIQQNRQK